MSTSTLPTTIDEGALAPAAAQDTGADSPQLFPTETEIYLLPDGRVVIADLPAELADALARLGSVEPCALPHADEPLAPSRPCHPRPCPEEAVLPTITKLYPSLELFSDGEPPHNTLFVFGRGIGPGSEDELLLIDPPLNAVELFALPGHVAALFTGPATPIEGIALVDTQPGGFAHLRVGEHLLDVYSQAHSNVVLLPLLGLLCGGSFGSAAALPSVATESDGQAELDTLRLLAMLVREGKVRFYLPHVGEPLLDRVAIMERLADDVAYLHELRRVIPRMAQSGDGLSGALAIADTLLPKTRGGAANQARHAANITALYLATENRQN